MLVVLIVWTEMISIDFDWSESVFLAHLSLHYLQLWLGRGNIIRGSILRADIHLFFRAVLRSFLFYLVGLLWIVIFVCD